MSRSTNGAQEIMMARMDGSQCEETVYRSMLLCLYTVARAHSENNNPKCERTGKELATLIRLDYCCSF
jgi:hypothetical protein